jgi:hypothetical protein
MTSKIQTAGAYNEHDGYSFIINFDNIRCMTLEGLTKEDIYEIASCALCMLPEEDCQTLINS